jgi:hypothetical protein
MWMDLVIRVDTFFEQVAVRLYNLFGKVHPSEIINLDVTFARFMEPRLRAWLQYRPSGWPSAVDSYEEWIAILTKIHEATVIVARQYDDDYVDFDKAQEGLELLGKYFTALWD